jgi:hypothetical protein
MVRILCKMLCDAFFIKVDIPKAVTAFVSPTHDELGVAA